MRPGQLFLFSAIGLSLWSAVVTGCQAAPVVPLPETLAADLKVHLKDERLDIVTSIRGLPLGVRHELETLFGTRTLDIAEPGAAFQVTDEIEYTPRLPTRRLAVAGCSIDHCLVYYERGGDVRTWRAALFHWTPEATRVEGGGTAPGGLETVDDVRNAMLSGAVTNANAVW